MNTPPENPPVKSAGPFRSAVPMLAKNPAFLVVLVILLAASVGLNYTTHALKLHFRKLPVSLQKPIAQMPKHLGPWVQVSVDQPLSGDIEEVLGTDKYIFRDFVDSRVVPKARLDAFEGKSSAERSALLYGRGEDKEKGIPRVRGILEDFPASAFVRLSLTYYTGMVDTVAHIPDRCFIADGYQPTEYTTPYWKIEGFPVGSGGYRLDGEGKRVSDPARAAGGADEGLPVRFINFEDQDNRSRGSTPKSVTYFFSANGHYVANPIDVRFELQNLFEKHGYYAKVELMTLLRDRDESARVKRSFLQHALPELEKCLPDWAAVKSGTANVSSVARPDGRSDGVTTKPSDGM